MFHCIPCSRCPASETRLALRCRECLPFQTPSLTVPSLVSTALGMHSLPVSILVAARSRSSCHTLADYRSQYYPSSNVQTSDMASDISNDEPLLSEPLDPLDSVDNSCAERRPRCMGVPEQNSAPLEISGTAVQTAGMRGRPSPRQPTGAHGGRETTPLLRKAASFTVVSSKPTPASAGRINYKPPSHPGVPNTMSQNPTPVLSATVVEHRNGKSTYGQTVSLVENHVFKRCLMPVSSCSIAPQCFWG